MSNAQPRGQGFVEYAIALALIALIAFGALTTLGGGIAGVFKHTLEPVQGQTTVQEFGDDFEGHGSLKWECTNGWIWWWRKNRRCETYGGGWRLRNGRWESRSLWSRAVAPLPGTDYTYSVDMQVRSPWWWRWWHRSYYTSRVVFRYQDSKNYYALVPRTDGTLELAKRENGRWRSRLAYVRVGIDPTQTHNYKVKVQGNQIQVWVDDQQVMTYQDPHPISQGGVGVENFWSYSAMDNVRVTMGQ